MTQLVPRPEFEALFDGFARSAWRLECQGAYHEPEEEEPLRRFLHGEPDDLNWYADWQAWVREVAASGRTIGRVRTLTDPLTDYLRFELELLTPPATAAGEDIGLLTAAVFDELALPREDFWIFDDRTVAVLHFGEAGVLGAELVTEQPRVADFLARKAATVERSMAFEDWATAGARD